MAIEGTHSDKVVIDEANDLATEASGDPVPDEAGSIYDQEVGELHALMETYHDVKKLNEEPKEQFHPINRAARRDFEKRNRALKKRKPNG